MNKVLTSIGKACDAGNVALFTKDGGYIFKEKDVSDMVKKMNNLKDKVQMIREKGVYTYELFMRKKKADDLQAVSQTVSTHNRYDALDDDLLFKRQGRLFTRNV